VGLVSGSSSFTHDDIEQILRIVDRLTDVEVRIEHGDLKLHVRKFSGVAPETAASIQPAASAKPESRSVPAATVAPARSAAQASELAPEGAVAVRAPMLGRFFRAPSPSEPAFVEVGKRVKAEDPVCLIEVMKLFTTVNAGVNGTVVAVPVENGEMVEHGQVLLLIRPE
jgi:acetyl-CoA carboxylase biotin carboxyl carrier protein